VQQVASVTVQAGSSQEAIDVAESCVDRDAWCIEEQIGAHPPKVLIIKELPIKTRKTGREDRRTNTDRRFDKRRLGDKSSALVEGQRKRST